MLLNNTLEFPSKLSMTAGFLTCFYVIISYITGQNKSMKSYSFEFKKKNPVIFKMRQGGFYCNFFLLSEK